MVIRSNSLSVFLSHCNGLISHLVSLQSNIQLQSRSLNQRFRKPPIIQITDTLQ
ncbi:hypothetical protein CEXT_351551, partial [Caerostris extrusa]